MQQMQNIYVIFVNVILIRLQLQVALCTELLSFDSIEFLSFMNSSLNKKLFAQGSLKIHL